MEWQELHIAFMELMREEDRILGGNRPGLRAMATYEARHGTYGMWILRDVATESLRTRFQLEATKAAREFGSVPAELRPWQYWLHRLEKHLESQNSQFRTVNGDIHLIHRVLDCSAMFCAHQQQDEIEESLHGRVGVLYHDVVECLQKAENDDAVIAESPSAIARTGAQAKELSDSYFATFPDAVKLDACWAARQRYREYVRWIGGKLKVGSKPDRSFRALFMSGKRPAEYRSERRPKGWK